LHPDIVLQVRKKGGPYFHSSSIARSWRWPAFLPDTDVLCRAVHTRAIILPMVIIVGQAAVERHLPYYSRVRFVPVYHWYQANHRRPTHPFFLKATEGLSENDANLELGQGNFFVVAG
jgi:hypothetical protein